MSFAQRALAGTFATAMAIAPGIFAQSKPGDQSPKEPVKMAQNFKPAAIDPGLKNPSRELPFHVLDVRGKGEAYSGVLSIAASRKHFTILEIHGDDPALRRRAEDTLLGIYRSGRTGLSLIIGDGDPKEWNIYAEGHRRNYLDKADDSGVTELVALQELEAAYDTYTAPALKAAQDEAAKKTTSTAPILANDR